MTVVVAILATGDKNALVLESFHVFGNLCDVIDRLSSHKINSSPPRYHDVSE